MLKKYQDIVEYAQKEIKGVRHIYIWLASILGLIIIVGMWFTYNSAKDFRGEMRENINEHKEDIQVLKKEVERRVDKELGKEAIQNLIKEKVTIRVDKVAESIITKQIEGKINPKLSEAEKQLIVLDKEIAKIKHRNQMTELADKAISDASRFALDELKKIENESEDGSLKHNAAEAEAMRVVLLWKNARRLTNVPGTVHYDDSGINYSKLSTTELINLLLSDKRWQVRRECARLLNDRKEADVAVALAKTLKNDSDLGVIKAALRSFKNITGMTSWILLDYDGALEWWEKNEAKVVKKLKREKYE